VDRAKAKKMEPDGSSENKIRIPVWVYPSTLDAIDRARELDNCKSRSEFLDKAARFYAEYVSTEDTSSYLTPVLLSAIKGVIQDSENRIARLLFKQAVELDMVMNVLAAGMEIGDDQLKALRGRCVQEVKKTGGAVTLDQAVRYQRGGG
jgi:hypothetical protein